MIAERHVPSYAVCVISHDVVGTAMAGPGIRYFQMARVLSEFHKVTLAVPANSSLVSTEWPFRCVVYNGWETLEPYVRDQDVLVFASDLAYHFSQLAQVKAALVVDGYDPLLAEWLALSTGYSAEARSAWWPERMCQLTYQYLIGDFYLCASERQRDWWLGLLEASGRLNPPNFHRDPSLLSLIDVVPFGLPEVAPQWTKPVFKGHWPGIDPEDKVVLWGGGLWSWLDPLTAIQAMAEIEKVRQDVRLVFPGTKHPNPNMVEMPTHYEAAKSLAIELGLLDKSVFFGEWIPYADWPNALLESDVALTLHFDTLETRLAFRSRVLDYIWAGLPIVATRGDETSNIVTQYNIGHVVNYQDVSGVATAILALLEQPINNTQLENFECARQQFNWRRAMEPLVRFCAAPRRASDRELAAVHPGNPFYAKKYQEQVDLQTSLARMRAELTRMEQSQSDLLATIQAYEHGRFMRAMRWLDHLKRKFLK